MLKPSAVRTTDCRYYPSPCASSLPIRSFETARGRQLLDGIQSLGQLEPLSGAKLPERNECSDRKKNGSISRFTGQTRDMTHFRLP